MSHHTGPHRVAAGSVRKQRSEESMGKRLYYGFVGRNERGRISSLSGIGLDSLNNFSEFWAIGWFLVVQYLVLGSLAQRNIASWSIKVR